MVRSILFTVVAFGVVCVTTQAASAANQSGGRWYPFYGYNRPSYLGPSASAVVVQPTTPGPQVVTAYYPPSDGTIAPPAPVVTSPRTRTSSGGGGWYPFYGNHRPAYLDR